ncbi:MAG: signal peptidase I [Xanthobacteraceae bacterium]|nr:signal peptidase I [Xanthobacteraceae bacterium]
MSDEVTRVKSQRSWSRSIAEILTAFLVVMVAKGALAEPFYVPSASMEPTLLIGDALLASKYPYGYSTASVPVNIALPSSSRVFGALPAPGDVVVFRWPGDTSQAWVKRVVGLPGDRVQMRGGHLWINGKPVEVRPDGFGRAEDEAGYGTTAARYVETLPSKGSRAHTIFKLRTHGALDDTPEVIVPPEHLFVMGDNRDNSADSRVPVSEGGVGLLPVENLVGRVDTIVGSWDFTIKKQPIWTWLSGVRLSRSFTSVQ